MILAAGRGQRMRPLTSVLPKPALPMTDGPVVASAMRLAASAGATRIVVNVSHLAKQMAEAVSGVTIDGVEIVLSFEDELMGTLVVLLWPGTGVCSVTQILCLSLTVMAPSVSIWRVSPNTISHAATS